MGILNDVRLDGCQNARLVAGRHLMHEPLQSIDSGVVSLRGLRLVCFLTELNFLKLCGADVGSVYLKACAYSI